MQNRIERCLRFYMNQKEVIDTLCIEDNIEPRVTELGIVFNGTLCHLIAANEEGANEKWSTEINVDNTLHSSTCIIKFVSYISIKEIINLTPI